MKKTWVLGHDRNGDDIKIEEVLQKSDLEVAVLSSFQLDADCTSSFAVCSLRICNAPMKLEGSPCPYRIIPGSADRTV